MFISITAYYDDIEEPIELDLFSIEYLCLADKSNLEAGTLVYLSSGRYFHAKEQIHRLRNKIAKEKNKFAYDAIVDYLIKVLKIEKNSH